MCECHAGEGSGPFCTWEPVPEDRRALIINARLSEESGMQVPKTRTNVEEESVNSGTKTCLRADILDARPSVGEEAREKELQCDLARERQGATFGALVGRLTAGPPDRRAAWPPGRLTAEPPGHRRDGTDWPPRHIVKRREGYRNGREEDNDAGRERRSIGFG